MARPLRDVEWSLSWLARRRDCRLHHNTYHGRLVGARKKDYVSYVFMPQLTHFLAIPLNSTALHAAYTRFISSLGHDIHHSIVRPYASLHFTIGVLSLDQAALTKTLELLHGVHKDIQELHIPPLLITLYGLQSMNEITKTRVLYTAPALNTDVERLAYICEMIKAPFAERDMLQDKRPLKLHCTLLNTVYHKPRPKRRYTVDATDIIAREFIADAPIESFGLYEMGAAEDGTYTCVQSFAIP